MSPKKRLAKNKRVPPHIDPLKLPPMVYYDPRGRGRWTMKFRHDGRLTEMPMNLDRSASMRDLWDVHARLTAAPAKKKTFRWLSEQFQASSKWKGLSPLTQRDYRICHNAICGRKTKSGTLLGDVDLKSWTTGMVRRYRDARSEESASRTNHELRYISRVFSWGLEYEQSDNKLDRIERVKEKPRRHYATDADYLFALGMAKGGYLAPFMELAYLCRMRKSEVLDLTLANETDEGIIINRRKGSRGNLTRWNPRLRAAWDEAKSRLKGKPQKLDAEKQLLFIGPDYARMKESTIDTAWQRLMRRCVDRATQEGRRFTPFTMHDLKRKGVSETSEDQKRPGSGHKTESVMRDHYDVLLPEVDPARD